MPSVTTSLGRKRRTSRGRQTLSSRASEYGASSSASAQNTSGDCFSSRPECDAVYHIVISAWGRVLLVAVAMLPLVLVVVLSAPSWLVAPFLAEPRRRSVATHLREIRRWHSDSLDRLSRSLAEATQEP